MYFIVIICDNLTISFGILYSNIRINYYILNLVIKLTVVAENHDKHLDNRPGIGATANDAQFSHTHFIFMSDLTDNFSM